MKHYLALLAMLALLGNLLAVAPRIKIGELELLRAYVREDSPVELRVYLPAGEALDRWSRLASVRVCPDLKDPQEYLANLAAIVTNRHPTARCQFLQNDRTRELILDFVIVAPGSGPLPVTEWNLLRAKYVPGTGLLVYQFATRFHRSGEGIGALINAERSKMTGLFEKASFEEQ